MRVSVSRLDNVKLAPQQTGLSDCDRSLRKGVKCKEFFEFICWEARRQLLWRISLMHLRFMHLRFCMHFYMLCTSVCTSIFYMLLHAPEIHEGLRKEYVKEGESRVGRTGLHGSKTMCSPKVVTPLWGHSWHCKGMLTRSTRTMDGAGLQPPT